MTFLKEWNIKEDTSIPNKMKMNCHYLDDIWIMNNEN